jgi:2-oxoglutarate ferredoxin oxidoreductase subunit beta
MQKIVARAMAHKGFSVIEVMSNCHTYYGKMTGMKTAVDMLRWMKETTAPVTMSEDRRVGQTPRGVLVDRQAPEYSEQYKALLERAREDKTRLLAAGMPIP